MKRNKTIRFTQEEWDWIECEAAKEACIPSEWVRKKVLAEGKESGFDKGLSHFEIMKKTLSAVTFMNYLMLQYYQDKGDEGFVKRAREKTVQMVKKYFP